MLKRAFDFVSSAVALLVLAPILLACTLAIRLDNSGPVLFRQERIGRFGRPFRILKFRTMVHREKDDGPLITAAGDARITATGQWLRRTKLDELPQLINVLLGDMSLVGPRPEASKYVDLYPPGIRDLVLSVRPGITDEASILFRHESDVLGAESDPEVFYIEKILPQKLEIHARYARSHSLMGDLRILTRTIRAVLA